MHITGIGIDVGTCCRNGNSSQFQEYLSYLHSCGFDIAELSIQEFDVIVGGHLQQQRVEKVLTVTREVDFVYTVHAPLRLNLAFPQSWPGHTTELAQEKDVFAASLDFCAAINAPVMVYHSGLIALRQVAFGLSALPDDEVLERAREQEVTALRELMPLAQERGVVVAMENRDPHSWEIAALRQAGGASDQLGKYHAGMRIPDLVRQVEAVGHPNLGLALDFAHLFLAATYCGFDYLEAIRQAAPHIRHLHGNDNFGRLGGVFDDLSDRIPYGDGDVHLPPGWGKIPFVEAFAQLPEYKGMLILELRERFHEHFPEAVETIWRIIRERSRKKRENS